jgi:hypothetical protein
MLDTINHPTRDTFSTTEAAIVQWLESRFGVGFPALTQAQASSLIYLSASVAVNGWELAMDEFIERSTEWRRMSIPIGLMQAMSQNGEEIATACIRIVSRMAGREDSEKPIDCALYQSLNGPASKSLFGRFVDVQLAPKSQAVSILGGGRKARTA